MEGEGGGGMEPYPPQEYGFHSAFFKVLRFGEVDLMLSRNGPKSVTVTARLDRSVT